MKYAKDQTDSLVGHRPQGKWQFGQTKATELFSRAIRFNQMSFVESVSDGMNKKSAGYEKEIN